MTRGTRLILVTSSCRSPSRALSAWFVGETSFRPFLETRLASRQDRRRNTIWANIVWGLTLCLTAISYQPSVHLSDNLPFWLKCAYLHTITCIYLWLFCRFLDHKLFLIGKQSNLWNIIVVMFLFICSFERKKQRFKLRTTTYFGRQLLCPVS